MSPPKLKSVKTSMSDQARKPNVSSGIQLPPIAALEQPPHETSELHPPIQQDTSSNLHYQLQHAQYGSSSDQPRHIPSLRSMSSSSSTATRPRMAPIDNLLNKDTDFYDKSAVSSISSSAITSPIQSSIRGTPPGGDPTYYGSTTTRHAEHPPTAESRRGSMLPPPPLTTNVSRSLDPELPPSMMMPIGGTAAQNRARMKLVIRQQPKAARACGLGERDRRVIDPPPILQLQLEDYDANSESDKSLLRSPFNVVHCQLISTGDDQMSQSGRDVSMISDPNDPRNSHQRILMGQLTISPFITQDLHPSANQRIPDDANIGSYYIFSDLSCRKNGRYRLRFMLMQVAAADPVGGRAETGHVVESNEFTVYSAKDFPGMLQSSDLTKRLKSLGASVHIKKGNEGRKTNTRKRTSDNSDGSGDDT